MVNIIGTESQAQTLCNISEEYLFARKNKIPSEEESHQRLQKNRHTLPPPLLVNSREITRTVVSLQLFSQISTSWEVEGKLNGLESEKLEIVSLSTLQKQKLLERRKVILIIKIIKIFPASMFTYC